MQKYKVELRARHTKKRVGMIFIWILFLVGISVGALLFFIERI